MDRFKQMVAYTNNYKETGYLVVDNLNPIEILIKSVVTGLQFLQRVLF